MGLDFNSQLVEGIIKVKGANYFSVHTPGETRGAHCRVQSARGGRRGAGPLDWRAAQQRPEDAIQCPLAHAPPSRPAAHLLPPAGEFKQRLEGEFDFMVAPLVFDLELRVDPASLAPQQAQLGPAAADGGAPAPPGQENREAALQSGLEEAEWELAEAGGEDGPAPGGGGGDPQPPAAAAPAPAAEVHSTGGGWKVVQIYGSPDSEERRLSGGGSIMRVGAGRVRGRDETRALASLPPSANPD